MTKLLWLTTLASEANSAIDYSKIKVSMKEMRDILQRNKLFEFLAKYKDEFGATVGLMTDAKDRDYLNRNLEDLALAMEGREKRKFAVENNGLCLLLGYLIELLQRNAGQQQATWDVKEEEKKLKKPMP
jgi:hypothetical protein